MLCYRSVRFVAECESNRLHKNEKKFISASISQKFPSKNDFPRNLPPFYFYSPQKTDVSITHFVIVVFSLYFHLVEKQIKISWWKITKVEEMNVNEHGRKIPIHCTNGIERMATEMKSSIDAANGVENKWAEILNEKILDVNTKHHREFRGNFKQRKQSLILFKKKTKTKEK